MWLELLIAQCADVADGIRSYALRSPVGDPLPPFAAGAHVRLRLAGDTVRRYSLTGDPAERDVYRIAVLREERGAGGSRHIHATWREGDIVAVSEPENHFPLAGDAAEALLIAGGIGITPILAMASELRRRDASFSAIYIASQPAKAAFTGELADLVPQERLTLAHAGRNSPGLDLETAIGAHRPGRHVYVCGPAELIQQVRSLAQDWPHDHVHFESFATAIAGAKQTERAFEIELASTGAVYTVAPDQTILGVLEKHGLGTPSLCREGYCGTCLVGVVRGVPDHRDTVLSDGERAANREIAICCSRSKTGRLVLDL